MSYKSRGISLLLAGTVVIIMNACEQQNSATLAARRGPVSVEYNLDSPAKIKKDLDELKAEDKITGQEYEDALVQSEEVDEIFANEELQVTSEVSSSKKNEIMDVYTQSFGFVSSKSDPAAAALSAEWSQQISD